MVGIKYSTICKSNTSTCQRFSDANPSARFVTIEPLALLAGDVTPKWKLHIALRQALLKKIAEEFGGIFCAHSGFTVSVARSPPPAVGSRP